MMRSPRKYERKSAENEELVREFAEMLKTGRFETRHMAITVFDVVCHCIERSEPPYPWAAARYFSAFEKLWGAKETAEGKRDNLLSRWRKDIEHFDRYDAVMRAAAIGFKGEKKLIKANELLGEAQQATSLETVRKSHQTVQRKRKTRSMLRYRLPMSAYVLKLMTQYPQKG